MYIVVNHKDRPNRDPKDKTEINLTFGEQMEVVSTIKGKTMEPHVSKGNMWIPSLTWWLKAMVAMEIIDREEMDRILFWVEQSVEKMNMRSPSYRLFKFFKELWTKLSNSSHSK